MLLIMSYLTSFEVFIFPLIFFVNSLDYSLVLSILIFDDKSSLFCYFETLSAARTLEHAIK